MSLASKEEVSQESTSGSEIRSVFHFQMKYVG